MEREWLKNKIAQLPCFQMVQLCLEFSPTVRLLRRVRGFREVDEGQEEDHQHQGDRRR